MINYQPTHSKGGKDKKDKCSHRMVRLQKSIRHHPTNMDNRMFENVSNLWGSRKLHQETYGKLNNRSSNEKEKP